MSKDQPTRGYDLARRIKKFFVSAFVAFTFIAYALHERFVNLDGTASAIAPTQRPAATRQVLPSPEVIPTAPQLASPTAQTVPTPPAAARGSFKDGQYTGDEVDAYYGLVRVQADIQGGRITNIQFLEYPNDRRTSVRINSIAIPYLTTEAIQAQSADVDIISGATLTSEAFAQSLQTALNTAKS